MEAIKNFFTTDKFKHIWISFYSGFEKVLDTIFGKIKYDPIRELFTNPWFWIILLILFILSLILRRR